MNQSALILEQAAEYLETNGWWGHKGIKDGNSACADVAISLVCCAQTRCLSATEMLSEFYRVEKIFAEYIIKEHGAVYKKHTALTIYRWNDTPGRTRKEVCRALRACAAALNINIGVAEEEIEALPPADIPQPVTEPEPVKETPPPVETPSEPVRVPVPV